MGTLNGRVAALEVGVARRPTPADVTRRELLRGLSLDELETLDGAIVALEAGVPLTMAQQAAIDAWECLTSADESDSGGVPCAG